MKMEDGRWKRRPHLTETTTLRVTDETNRTQQKPEEEPSPQHPFTGLTGILTGADLAFMVTNVLCSPRY